MHKRPELDRDDFYAQFHNLDKHHDTSNYSAPEWYDLIDENGNHKRPARAAGGAIDKDTESVKLSEHFK